MAWDRLPEATRREVKWRAVGPVCHRPEEAIQKVRARQPDVILLDLVMPTRDGLEANAAMMRDNPRSRILVLTSFATDDKVFPALKAGTLGYLLKDSPPQALLQAIRDVYRGHSSLHPVIARKVIHELHGPASPSIDEESLTDREVEILRQVAQGLTNQQIAHVLNISERTVSTHITSILEKLCLNNRVQATLYALREGLVVLS